jgi:hypothetical protein
MYFVDQYKTKARTPIEETGFTWREVREFDALIGFSLLSVGIYVLFALYFGIWLVNSGSLILVPMMMLLLCIMKWLRIGIDEICLSLFSPY